jgi:hypothetical protein
MRVCDFEKGITAVCSSGNKGQDAMYRKLVNAVNVSRLLSVKVMS